MGMDEIFYLWNIVLSCDPEDWEWRARDVTFVETDVLKGEGSQLDLLPTAPLINFMSDPSFFYTNLHPKSLQRNTEAEMSLYPYTMCPSAGASEGGGQSHSSEVSKRGLGMDFLLLLLLLLPI